MTFITFLRSQKGRPLLILNNLTDSVAESVPYLSLKVNKRFLSLKVNEFSDETKQLFDVQSYRQTNGIQCFGDSIVDPISSFDCCEWPLVLKNRIRSLGYVKPTPVQSQCLPLILGNRDLVAIANSGSGKSLCFVLPALMRTLRAGLDEWPKCLILSPTRELTHQIERVVKQFQFVRSVCLYGGVSYEVQQMFLKRANPHIVIATPSRLKVILEKEWATLQNIDYVAIDEADHMLGLGLQSDLSQIMQFLPKKRQTLMFSATWPQKVQTLAEDFLKDYVRVVVSQNKSIESLTVNKNIQQIVKVCKQSEKLNFLIESINSLVPTVSGFIKTIIFVRHKKTADQLVRLLKRESYPSKSLHSNKTQNEREFVIREFRRGTVPILIATDIAARGLDFKNVKLVINYDFPSKIEDYIHRIGRTGRHQEKGKAITFFTSKNICHKSSLIDVLRESQQVVDPTLIDLNSQSEEDSEEFCDKKDSGYESHSESETTDSDIQSEHWDSDKQNTNH